MKQKINIELTVDIDGLDYLPDITEKVMCQFLNWNEGRYPFWVESFKVAATKICRQAIYEQIGEIEQDKYPGEMIPYTSKGGSEGYMAKWLDETEKIYDKLHVTVLVGEEH